MTLLTLTDVECYVATLFLGSLVINMPYRIWCSNLSWFCVPRPFQWITQNKYLETPGWPNSTSKSNISLMADIYYFNPYQFYRADDASNSQQWMTCSYPNIQYIWVTCNVNYKISALDHLHVGLQSDDFIIQWHPVCQKVQTTNLIRLIIWKKHGLDCERIALN